jgi:hypothetical protein
VAFRADHPGLNNPAPPVPPARRYSQDEGASGSPLPSSGAGRWPPRGRRRTDPFTLADASEIYTFDVAVSGKRPRFEMLTPSGGNAGVVDLDEFGELVR